ncbi:MAG: fused MFS/spermidine synthase [Planctomycetes bacterium]|nr:fused MFS/spermidine synthase [Planctomycetota bacterium]
MSDRPRSVRALAVLALFLVSGASGLVYEVVWSRWFTQLLGTTIYAVSTVLGVFMGGLALGAWLFGRVADRPRANGLRIYGVLELAIGIYVLLLPALIDAAEGIYVSAWPLVEASFAGQLGLRFALVVAILIVPATLMGGTLPALSRHLVTSPEHSAREIGMLYAINTLGAVLGCATAGFVLLEHLGLSASLYLAAALNFAVAVLALWLARRPEPTAVTPPRAPDADAEQPVDGAAAGRARLALGLYALCGFAALALEVLWTRSLMYFVSVDTWAFTSMLSAFLCGIGLGSLVIAQVESRIRRPLLALGILQVGVAIGAAASIPLFDGLYAAQQSFESAVAVTSKLGRVASKLFASFFVMLLPTLLMGASFPIASRIWVQAKGQVGRGVGTLYAINTVGAIAGSTMAGFVLIPWLGLKDAVLAMASLYALIGAVLIAAARARGPLLPPVVAAGVPAAIVLLIANALYHGEPMARNLYYFQRPEDPHELVYSDEGVAASLAIIETARGSKLLNINGVTTAADNYLDMQVHRMLSHLAVLAHPDPRTALIVGFGMGSTAYGVCQHPLERVDVVELLRAERRTAPYFEHVNHGILGDERLHFIEGDGRNYLLATERRYDVISFNAIHPRFSSNLYTADFYRLCLERLTDDGVICAWLTQNRMPRDVWRMLCASLVEVFPHCSLWYSNPEHYCLLGSRRPLRIDPDVWAQRMALPAVATDLADSNLADPAVMLTRFVLGDADLRRYLQGAVLNTDDRPRIEFSAEFPDDERPIVEELLRLRSPLDTILAAPPAGADPSELRARLPAYEASARLLFRGQIDFWYPLAKNSLQAEIHYLRALQLTPDNQDVRENLLFSDRRVAVVEAAAQANPDAPQAQLEHAQMLRQQGRFDDAERTLRGLLDRYGSVGSVMQELGLLRLLRGDAAGAIDMLLPIPASGGRLDMRHGYALGVALDRAGRTGEALAFLGALRREVPEIDEWWAVFESASKQMAARAGG